MRTQQQAEREEQQRIKNLVLNYDLRESEDQDGDNYQTPIIPNTNIHTVSKSGHEKPPYHPNRLEKSGKERSGQRVRRLQLSDVDWYDKTHGKKRPLQNASASEAQRIAYSQVEESASQPTGEGALNKCFVASADGRPRSTTRRSRTKG